MASTTLRNNAVTMEAQNYMRQFKTSSKSQKQPGASFEVFLDSWTREKYKPRKERQHDLTQSNDDWPENNLFVSRQAPYEFSSVDFRVDGEIFAQTEFEDEQETYMNEEALLDQLLQEEPRFYMTKMGQIARFKMTQSPVTSKRTEEQRYSQLNGVHSNDLHGSNLMSRRGLLPPPPPPVQVKRSKYDQDQVLLPCHNCGWTYTIAENEVFDLPELLDSISPNSHQTTSSHRLPHSVHFDDMLPPPLPSKPRPPPPFMSGQTHSMDTHTDHNIIQIHNMFVPQGMHQEISHEDVQEYTESVQTPFQDTSISTKDNTHVVSAGTISPRNRRNLFNEVQFQTTSTQTDHFILPELDFNLQYEKSSDADVAEDIARVPANSRSKPPTGRRSIKRQSTGSELAASKEPVLEAAIHGQLERLVDIIEKDPEQAKQRDIQGNTITHICCERGHISCLEFIYDNFPQQIEEENKNKFTPAVLAIKNGQAEALEWLLEKTIARDEILPLPNNKSLLHHAAKFGQDNCLRIILEKLSAMGRLATCSDYNGNSPAHVAAKHGHLACLQTFVEYGLDVTKANRYGHSACYYADFSNHRQCAAYLMVVETCMNLAKKLIRLEKSMEQLSNSMTKYSGYAAQNGEIVLGLDGAADKSSATSSVEDDCTRDDAWGLLCRKFDEASKRLVVFRTQNRTIRPLRPTKLAFLALSQNKDDNLTALSSFLNETHLFGSKSFDDGSERCVPNVTKSRSQSYPDLLNIPAPSENASIRMEQPQRMTLNKSHEMSGSCQNIERKTGFDTDNSYKKISVSQCSLSSDNNDSNIFQNIVTSGRKPNDCTYYNNIHPTDNTVNNNDFDCHLQTRSFKNNNESPVVCRQKYFLPQDRRYREPEHSVDTPELTTKSTTFRHVDIPPPPLCDNETSDFFEENCKNEESDTSELDQETLRKIFEMQREIMMCHPQNQDTERSGVKTPIKLKLSDQEFLESYARGDPQEHMPLRQPLPIWKQLKRRHLKEQMTRQKQQPHATKPDQLNMTALVKTRTQDTVYENMLNSPACPSVVINQDEKGKNAAYIVETPQGCSLSPGNSFCSSDRSLETGATGEATTQTLKKDDTVRHRPQNEMNNDENRRPLQPTHTITHTSLPAKAWYEITDDEEMKQPRLQSEEYFTLL